MSIPDNFCRNVFEMEVLLIGSLLVRPELVNELKLIADPTMFRNKVAAIAYTGAIDLFRSGAPVEAATVYRWAIDNGFFEDAEVRNKLRFLLFDALSQHTSVHGTWYAQKIREAYWKRVSKQKIDEGDPLGARQALELSESTRNFRSLLEIDRDADALALRLRLKDPEFPTGFLDMVKFLPAGFQRKSLTVIGAYTSHLKTTLACHFALSFLNAGRCGLYANYESGDVGILNRLIAAESVLPRNIVARREFQNPEDLSRFKMAQEKVLSWSDRFSILESPNDSILEATVAERSPDFIIIDYIQLLAGAAKRRGDVSVASHVAALMARIESICVQRNIVGIVLSQLNREGSGKKPMMNQLKDSSGIEQSAGIVLLGYWPWKDDQTLDPSKYRIEFAKNRDGECGSLNVFIEPKSGQMRNLAMGGI